MITKTVTYEIEPTGDCNKCECLIEYEYHDYCKAFDTTMNCYGEHNQCKECEDYIKEQTRCLNCKHQGDYPDWECEMGNDPKTCEEWSE